MPFYGYPKIASFASSGVYLVSMLQESSEESEEELAIPNSEQEAAGTSSQQRVDHFSVQFIIDGKCCSLFKLCYHFCSFATTT